jgi:hypothetical protein
MMNILLFKEKKEEDMHILNVYTYVRCGSSQFQTVGIILPA